MQTLIVGEGLCALPKKYISKRFVWDVEGAVPYILMKHLCSIVEASIARTFWLMLFGRSKPLPYKLNITKTKKGSHKCGCP